METYEIGKVLYKRGESVSVVNDVYSDGSSEGEEETQLGSSSDEEDRLEQLELGIAIDSVDSTERVSKALGHGIVADLPPGTNDLDFQLEELDVIKRNWQIRDMKLLRNERIMSPIYETTGRTNVRMPDDVSISVPVRVPRNKVVPEKLYIFSFMVELKGKWTRHPAKYKNRNVVGPIHEFKSVCVIARLQHEEHVVTPRGYTFVSEQDNDVTVEFPPVAVSKNTRLKFIVETVDLKRRRQYQTYNPTAYGSILAFSTILHVLHSKQTTFSRHVQVTLPIHEADDYQEEDPDESEIVFLRWHGSGQVEVVQTEPINTNNSYSISVSHFSSYSAVKKTKASTNQDVLSAARILAGKENLCTLLCFIRLPGPSILLDVVESGRAERVSLRHKRKGLREVKDSRSRDIPIVDRERINVELAGNLVPVPGIPKDFYNMTFVKPASTNYISFPIQTRVSSATYSVITLRGHQGRWVHCIHLSLQAGSPKNFNVSPTTFPMTTHFVFQPEIKHRPVTDAPITRVVLKPKEPVCQFDDVRPLTSQSTLTALSNEDETEILFERPVSRMSVKSPMVSITPAPGLPPPPSPTTSTSSREFNLDHPMLKENSLLVLGDQLSLTEWNKAMVFLNVSTADIITVTEEATKQNFPPAFKLLLHWVKGNKGRNARDLINDVMDALVDLHRNDLAEVIRKAGRTHRPLRKADFKKM